MSRISGNSALTERAAKMVLTWSPVSRATLWGNVGDTAKRAGSGPIGCTATGAGVEAATSLQHEASLLICG
jgi:hypothetical protein